jgi:hypothetical protein
MYHGNGNEIKNLLGSVLNSLGEDGGARFPPDRVDCEKSFLTAWSLCYRMQLAGGSEEAKGKVLFGFV